jgi:hypothetical protein
VRTADGNFTIHVRKYTTLPRQLDCPVWPFSWRAVFCSIQSERNFTKSWTCSGGDDESDDGGGGNGGGQGGYAQTERLMSAMLSAAMNARVMRGCVHTRPPFSSTSVETDST